MTTTSTSERREVTAITGGVGEPVLRPDGGAKVDGSFEFSSDRSVDGELWAVTVRSPHPRARILNVDVSAAVALPGVAAVITADDVPGVNGFGLVASDQPVFAVDEVRFVGEPVAAVAATDAETCARAAELVVVTYEVLEPLLDAERAIDGTFEPIHPDGNLIRHQRIVRGDSDFVGEVIVEGTYEIGMQDQAFLGLEAAVAVPDADGAGVELLVATQWLHEDRRQIATCLGVDEERVKLTLGGVGGAFGGREDISLQVHVSLLALVTGRPVRAAYSRSESFIGHVHRHPAAIWMRHHADRDGTLRKVEARFVLDGGAYASTSSAVLINAVTHAQGPYRCENAVVDGYAVRTNHLPCGAMRGFGVVQACFAHERQMDRLAAACDMDPVDLRLLNAMETGDHLITGQRVENVAPVARCIRETMALPLPEPETEDHVLSLPGGAGLTADGSVVRGVGMAVSIKNLMYSEGFDDYSTARCVVRDGRVALKFATAEVGQGFVTIAMQIARTELGLADVDFESIDTAVGSAGSTSASRQTWMSGGAVVEACRGVVGQILDQVATDRELDRDGLRIEGEWVTADGVPAVMVAEAVAGHLFEFTAEYHHPVTTELDEYGQGDCHTAFAFTAHRAVVDVDPDLGLLRVVQIATAQDVGRALNPLSVVGQIEGGVAQGLGLAVMEEIIQTNGVIRNASFTDYLIPTIADMPPVVISLVEEPDPRAPLGAKGVGEPPCISVTPAIVAAVDDALTKAGRRVSPLTRVPIRPQDIALAGEGSTATVGS